jgi:hypothetical protein
VREAKELQEKDFKAPTQIITNETELGEYRLRKRKEYEDTLRMKRWNLNWWMRVGAAFMKHSMAQSAGEPSPCACLCKLVIQKRT